VVNGVVYIQDLDANVYALALATGKLKWEYELNTPMKTGPGPDGVAVVGGMVYGISPTTVFALNARTGKKIWVNSHLLSKGPGDVRNPAASGRRAGVPGERVRLGARRRGASHAQRSKRRTAVEIQYPSWPRRGYRQNWRCHTDRTVAVT